VPTTTRRRHIAIAPEELWEIVSDPHHLPRWWPNVRRVEQVTEDGWTEVQYTKKGRPVRVDYRLEESDPPRLRRWDQELLGTPFERFLNRSQIELVIERSGDGSEVTLEQRQQLRGSSRTGGFLLKRSIRRRLDEALSGLAEISEG
jgi:uncharacterized protein YndB with AHSA1/START domain